LCAICGDHLPSWRVLSLTTGRCARCRRYPGAIDAGRSAGEYGGALREIIQAFKYERRRSLSRPLGALLRTAASDLMPGADCVVPVPLHPWRRVSRGFNQANDLAHALDIPVVPALGRGRHTASQTGLTAAARRRNLRDAIGLSPLLGRRAREQYVTGRIVVVVDDVRTTGATLDACARALKAAGATEVRAATVATARVWA
jgi:ComF family protein